MIKIYNTLTRQKEIFKPIEKNKVRMYLCGPTVYNYIHVGNARSTVAFDTVRRYLEYRGYEVHYISNFTDVDDKIIKGALEEGVSPKEIADKYIACFEEDTAKLKVKPACKHPRVVDHMDDIIEFITVLIKKGYAYESEGDVYYRARQFKKYGQLSNKSIDELETGASQRTGEEINKKEDPLDFALWKAAKVDEISWESPWGLGRPGWHIECSVMATKHLGETIDIHAGGQDLEFPHHENEIAQSEAKTGQTFANYWMHNAYLTVGESGEKMSKSLKNFVTAHELMEQMSPEVLRFSLATTHYRHPMPFNETILQEAEANLSRIKGSYNNALFRLKDAEDELSDDATYLKDLTELNKRFVTVMDDDFNTANGITVIYSLVKWLNAYIEKHCVSKVVLKEAVTLLKTLVELFGIELKTEEVLDHNIDELIKKRDEARSNKDFKTSDEIRDALKEKGIILEDTPQGTRWSRSE